MEIYLKSALKKNDEAIVILLLHRLVTYSRILHANFSVNIHLS